MEQVALTPTGVVALRVRQLRSERQWSAQRLAEEMTAVGLEWNRGVVTKLETGRRESISIAEVMALACAFNVSPIALIVPNWPTDYALAPNRVASMMIRVYDWIVGRVSQPLNDPNADPYIARENYIPAGLPDWLAARERQLASERDAEFNALRVRNAELEAEAKVKPHTSPEALLSLLERAERAAQNAELRAQQQAKLIRALMRSAAKGSPESVPDIFEEGRKIGLDIAGLGLIEDEPELLGETAEEGAERRS